MSYIYRPNVIRLYGDVGARPAGIICGVGLVNADEKHFLPLHTVDKYNHRYDQFYDT